MPRRACHAPLLLLTLALLGCSELHGTVPPGDAGGQPQRPVDTDASASDGGGGGDDGSASDATTDATSDATGDATTDAGIVGPGPLGALPSGYCCASDADCRSRQCVTFGSGGAMCVDGCHSDRACQGVLPNLRCGLALNRCEPVTPDAACVPADQFRLGTLPTGSCCAATNDSRSGTECLGGRCVAFGPETNPFFCTQVCVRHDDCPAPLFCVDVGGAAMICGRGNEAYTCK